MKRLVMNAVAVTVIPVLALACAFAASAPAQAATKLLAPAWPHVKHSGWHGLKLSWKAVEGADGYAVYRWSKAKRKYVRRAWAKKASWRDTGLKADRKHTYKVAAYRKTAGGKRRVGKKSYKVAAVTYSKGAKVVNPGRPNAGASIAASPWPRCLSGRPATESSARRTTSCRSTAPSKRA